VQFHTLDELKTPLTANQQTLVRALADGADIRDIAVSLGITFKAVRNRFDRIKNKTGDFSRNRRLCK
jgi:DNA-binding NarL/FixJ family response regulator